MTSATAPTLVLSLALCLCACGDSDGGGSGGKGGSASTGGDGGFGGDGAFGGSGALGGGGTGGVTVDPACAPACQKVADLATMFGCNANVADCNCPQDCGDELDALITCFTENSSECGCNAAGELDCGFTYCQNEDATFAACSE